MFNDPFENSVNSPTTPAESCFKIVPDDDADLPRATKALFIGEAGEVALVSVPGNDAVVFRNLAAAASMADCARFVRPGLLQAA